MKSTELNQCQQERKREREESSVEEAKNCNCSLEALRWIIFRFKWKKIKWFVFSLAFAFCSVFSHSFTCTHASSICLVESVIISPGCLRRHVKWILARSLFFFFFLPSSSSVCFHSYYTGVIFWKDTRVDMQVLSQVKCASWVTFWPLDCNSRDDDEGEREKKISAARKTLDIGVSAVVTSCFFLFALFGHFRCHTVSRRMERDARDQWQGEEDARGRKKRHLWSWDAQCDRTAHISTLRCVYVCVSSWN